MLPPSTALFSAGSIVSGLGPTCTDKIFSPVDAASLCASSVLSAGSSASVSAGCAASSALSVVSAALSASLEALLPFPPQAVRPNTMVAASKSASALFFIISSSS